MTTPTPPTRPQPQCRQDPEAMFVDGKAQNRAKVRCYGCPLRTPCLAYALNNRIEFGVWGGKTERERRALLRKHPRVDDWAAVFAAHEHAGGERTRRASQQQRHAQKRTQRALELMGIGDQR